VQALLSQLSMKQKLLLFIALPALFGMALALNTLWQLWQSQLQAQQVSEIISAQFRQNTLLNALQKERGSSGVFISSKGQNFSTEVSSARTGSDAGFAGLNKAQQQHWQTLWQQIADIRRNVDAFSINATAAAAAYTKAISSLLDANSQAVQQLSDPDLQRQLIQLNQWVELIEHAGRERALYTLAFSQGKPEPALLTRIALNQGAFDSFRSQVLRNNGNEAQVLTQAQTDAYQAAVRQISDYQSGQAAAVTLAPADWFVLSTKRIGQLIEHQHQLMRSTGTAAEQKQQQSLRQFWLTAGVLAVAMGLTFWLSLATNRNIKSAMAQINSVMQRLTGRDLTARSDYRARDEFGQIAGGINQLAGELQQVMQDIALAGEQLAAAAEQASLVTAQTSAGVAQQQQDTEMAATAMHEMSATVADVAQSTAEAAQQADAVQHIASQGQQQLAKTTTLIDQLCAQVQLTNERLVTLNQHSLNISQVLEVIRTIADQTNLLALNAAIEAARAGEHGRGFAVVADEVRTLAKRTQQSTVDIQQMIETLQQGATAASDAMQQSLQQAQQSTAVIQTTGTLLHDVVDGVARIHDKAAQIASAAEEQSMVADQINENITRINDISVQTSSGAEETAATAADLARLAEQLQSLIQRFKVAA